MFKRSTHIAAAIVLAALLISAGVPFADAKIAPSKHVVVVLAPFLSWADLRGGQMPNAARLAQRALLADMNVRAGGATGGSTPSRGAVVLSAGAPVEYADGALTAFSATETVGGTPARDLYRQYFGTGSGPAEVLYEGQPRQVLLNAANSLDSAIGALGTAAHAKGIKTAAIGNSDLGFGVDPTHSSRPAGEAAADSSGLVDLGDVTSGMLAKSPASPYGVRASEDGILTAYGSVVASGAGLVFVDPGDLYRANTLASSTTTAAYAVNRAAALRSLDAVIGGIVERLEAGDAIIILSQAVAPPLGMPAAFGPLLVAGPGGGGVGTAASTHRDGIVTEMDVSTTVLDLFGVKAPDSMVGSVVRASSTLAGAGAEERIAYLETLDTTSVAVESVRPNTVNWFIALAVIVMMASTFILYRGADGLPSSLTGMARMAVLLLVCAPLAGVLQFLVWRWPPSGLAVIGTLLAVTFACGAVAWMLGRGRPAAVPLLVVTAVTSVALLVDQYAGAPLSFAQIFGYSPLLGARYYGMGNEMAGLLLGSVMVAMALALDTWRDARWAKHLRTWGWPLVGAICVVTAAAPFWGANVGTVAWMTVGFLVGWMLLNGRKVWTWRNLALVLVIVIVVVAGLSVVDLLGGAGGETHLGRAVAGVGSSGIGSLLVIIARKAETNIRVLGRTNWTWMLVAVLILLGYMRWRPRGEFAELLKRFPAFSAALGAALLAGVAGYFTEDSGIIIPALMFIPVGVAALYLMLLPSHPGKEGPA